MSQDNLIYLKSKEAKGDVYPTFKNKKKLASFKLKLRKYSKTLRKHITFNESKK
ncbi:MAG: 50S ribosomal protein L33 [Candidatus Pacebacteria bacterium]|jgi:ribosomal protein L33|nr:50S ribosomal protein L33 [Candidatus Paceibacterota bacterium]